jgi:hypothetical protein
MRAYCDASNQDLGPYCQCEAGYQGDGFVCQPPHKFTPMKLLRGRINEPGAQVADLDIATLSDNRVALVFRDTRKLHKGYLLLGKAGRSGMTWGQPMLFSGQAQAFGPTVTELESAGDLRLAIAFRDQNQGGTATLLGVSLGQNGSVIIGTPKPFARHQAQRMAMVPLQNSSVAVLFSEHTLSGGAAKLAGGAMYGSALLARFQDSLSPPEVVGKRRFATGAVARITATKLSPKTFAVGFRRGADAKEEQAEASCVFAQLREGELIFGSQPALLEPKITQVWSRSIALVQENVLSYSYHSGTERLTKEAILRIDPVTESMTLLREPTVIGRGFTPYVGTVSTALLNSADGEPSFLQQEGPRLFTYYNKGNSNHVQARLCKATAGGIPAACQEVDWINHEILSIAGAPVGDGRLIFVYTDARGSPYYQLVGLLESGL